MVRFPVEKSGLHLPVARHRRESRKGFYAGQPYTAFSHNCSLTWRQP